VPAVGTLEISREQNRKIALTEELVLLGRDAHREGGVALAPHVHALGDPRNIVWAQADDMHEPVAVESHGPREHVLRGGAEHGLRRRGERRGGERKQRGGERGRGESHGRG
jgi:hypothetical protein